MGQPYVGELKIVSWNFPPKGWALCNGQSLAIAQNQALFSLLGTTFGGNGVTTFLLPDLRGRGPLHAGTMPGGSTYIPGQRAGESSHTLLVSELPLHPHTASGNNTVDAASNTNTATSSTSLGQSIGTPPTGVAFTANMYGSGTPTVALAPQTIVPAGGSQPHDNMQPYTVLNYIIALVGVFPSRN
jgi:microcystin-dependent protein